MLLRFLPVRYIKVLLLSISLLTPIVRANPAFETWADKERKAPFLRALCVPCVLCG